MPDGGIFASFLLISALPVCARHAPGPGFIASHHLGGNMRILSAAAAILALATSALAAPNVTNATQKGSLLIWPDIRVDNDWNTIIRISNDGSLDVDVICYWMDGNKNKVDFIFTITKNQAIWFDAKEGDGTFAVNRFP